MTNLDELLREIKYPTEEKVKTITRAYDFAKKAHADQKRYSGEPYFTHPFETALILAKLGMGRSTIAAGLLHDTLEDAGITPEELEKHFGKKILFLVKGVTKLGSIRYTGTERHIESLKKFFIAMSQDIRVLIIKLADRLHNMRTLEHVPEHKRIRIATETREIYVPLAHRLGIRTIKRELEDLVFKHLEPEHYNTIRDVVRERIQEKSPRLEKFRRNLLKILAKEKLENVSADTRIKSLYGIYEKCQRKHVDVDKIYDIHALRIHVNTVSDCYKTLGIIHNNWQPIPGRIKDYISFPKPNSYQSIHTTIFTGDNDILEIQIRTHDMHYNAEFGLAGHISYKELDNKSDFDREWIKRFFSRNKNKENLSKVEKSRVEHIPSWIRELVDVQSYITTPTEFMDNLKNDFFEARMFVFDINGEVIDLPIKSSVIDYAYAMDEKLANNLFGAQVNKKFVTLDTVLKNGDIVHLITKSTAHPSAKWLDYCRTTFAKQCIKNALEKLPKTSAL